jgi:hypothetical protein
MKVADLGRVEKIPIKDIKPYEKNPRKIPERAIQIVAESLKRFGWQQPIIVDKEHVLIAGHTRLLAARLIGEEIAPVIVATKLTEEECRAYRIADNRTHDFSAWDYPELLNQLDLLAGDFADVLGIADWQKILEEFKEGAGDGGEGLGSSDPLPGFRVSVVFVSKEAAEAAEQELLALAGIIDVPILGTT